MITLKFCQLPKIAELKYFSLGKGVKNIPFMYKMFFMVRRPPQIGGHGHKNIWAGVDYLKPTPNLEGYSWCVQELVLLQGGKGTFRNSKDSGRGKVEPWDWHSCKDSVPSGLGLQFWINPQKDFHWFTKTPFFDPKLHFLIQCVFV